MRYTVHFVLPAYNSIIMLRGGARQYRCLEAGDCSVTAITRSNCRACRYQACLAAGMDPALVDTAARRRPRNIKQQQSTPTPKLTLSPPAPSPVTNPDPVSVTTSGQGAAPARTLFLYDPEKNTMQPILLLDPPTEQEKEVEPAAVAQRVSVIRRVSRPASPQLDIAQLTEDCVLAELAGELQQNEAGAVLPFKKRPENSQLILEAIASSQEPVMTFTFEEEFRLHDLIVRRDYLLEEMVCIKIQKYFSLIYV